MTRGEKCLLIVGLSFGIILGMLLGAVLEHHGGIIRRQAQEAK